VKQQKNPEMYFKTLETLQKDANILGKRQQRATQNQNKDVKDNEEIKYEPNALKRLKVSDASLFKMEGAKTEEEMKEEQELIDLYGPKIKVVRWYFENNEAIKSQQNSNQSEPKYSDSEYNDEIDN